jgi:hypothetical protein
MTFPRPRRIASLRQLMLSVLAAGAITAALVASSSSARQSGGTTIKLIDDVMHPKTFNFVEPPPNPLTGDPTNNAAGDQIVSTNPLLNAHHKRIGMSYAMLTFVTGGKLPEHPSVVRDSLDYRLPKGSIFIEEENSGSFSDGIVIGGTGAYAGARGTIAQGKVFDTIHLLP